LLLIFVSYEQRIKWQFIFFTKILAIFNWLLSFFGYLFDSFIHKVLYTNKIIFNCAWEDPALDLQALELRKDKDNIIVITSAGCNVLTYAISAPNHIYSIDRNPCQNALLELKIAAIKTFDFDTFWKLFGEGKLDSFSSKYYPLLRDQLSTPSKSYWDSKAHYFDGKGLRNSFFYRGCSGLLAWVIVRIYCKLIPGVLPTIKAMFQAKSIEEQRKLYKEIDRKVWSPLFERVVSSRLALAFMNGVPKPQQRLLEEEGGAAAFLRKVVQWLFTESHLRNNYFYRVYIDGSYTKDCCPEYLKEANFYKLKNGLVDRISVHTTTITEFLNTHPSNDISRFVLLDHMDWLADTRSVLQEEWQAIVNHASDDARFLWRSASHKAQFVTDTKVNYRNENTTVGDILQFDVEKAERLHQIDRVHTYTSFHIGSFKTAAH